MSIYQNVQLHNVQVTECPGYQTSILQNVQDTKIQFTKSKVWLG